MHPGGDAERLYHREHGMEHHCKTSAELTLSFLLSGKLRNAHLANDPNCLLLPLRFPKASAKGEGLALIPRGQLPIKIEGITGTTPHYTTGWNHSAKPHDLSKSRANAYGPTERRRMPQKTLLQQQVPHALSLPIVWSLSEAHPDQKSPGSPPRMFFSSPRQEVTSKPKFTTSSRV